VDAFTSFVHVAYFAMGCQVPESSNGEGFVNIVVNTVYIGLDRPDISSAALVAAKKEGILRASREGCGYWQQHPESVQEMRRAADISFR
jgi:hypothetical protein